MRQVRYLTPHASHTFTIKNTGTQAQSFKISHVPAGTALSLQPVSSLLTRHEVNLTDEPIQGTAFPVDGPVPLSTNFATVKFSETSLTVHPGQTQEITAHITPPTGVDPSILPVFSGFIQVESATETFHVTYLGVGAALKDAQVVDDTATFFGVNIPIITDPAGDFITNATNFTFVGEDIPELLMRLDFGTPKLLLDLVDPNEKITTTLNQKRDALASPGGTFSQVKTLGNLAELDFQPRNTDMNVSLAIITLLQPV